MLIDKYDISSFTSYVVEKGGLTNPSGFITEFINMIVQFIFAIGKFFYNIVSFVMYVVMGSDVVMEKAEEVLTVSSTVYNSMFKQLTPLIGAIMGGYLLYLFFRKGQFWMKAFQLLAVVGLASFIFSNGGTLLSMVNSTSENVESTTLTVLNNAIPVFSTDNAKEVDTKKTIQSMYFDSAVLQPFLLINFGKTDVSKEDYEKILLSKNYEKSDVEKRDQEIESLSEKNRYLSFDKIGTKFTISIVSIVNSIGIGLCLLVLSLLYILLKVFILFILLLLPFMAILSFVPTFEGTIIHGLKTIGIFFVGSILCSVGISLFLYMMILIDNFSNSLLANVGNISGVDLIGSAYILSTVLKIVSIYLVVKYRATIAKLLTGGRVKRVDIPQLPAAPDLPADELLRIMQFSGGYMNQIGDWVNRGREEESEVFGEATKRQREVVEEAYDGIFEEDREYLEGEKTVVLGMSPQLLEERNGDIEESEVEQEEVNNDLPLLEEEYSAEDDEYQTPVENIEESEIDGIEDQEYIEVLSIYPESDVVEDDESEQFGWVESEDAQSEITLEKEPEITFTDENSSQRLDVSESIEEDETYPVEAKSEIESEIESDRFVAEIVEIEETDEVIEEIE